MNNQKTTITLPLEEILPIAKKCLKNIKNHREEINTLAIQQYMTDHNKKWYNKLFKKPFKTLTECKIYMEENAWDYDAFENVIRKTFTEKDIRTGLFLMKASGEIAESRNATKIDLDDVNKALEKLEKF